MLEGQSEHHGNALQPKSMFPPESFIKMNDEGGGLLTLRAFCCKMICCGSVLISLIITLLQVLPPAQSDE